MIYSHWGSGVSIALCVKSICCVCKILTHWISLSTTTSQLLWLSLVIARLYFGMFLTFYGAIALECFSGDSPVKNPPQLRRHRRFGFNPGVRKTAWRRKWQPTPVLWPGKSHEQRRLADRSPWGGKELETAEHHHHHHSTGESINFLTLENLSNVKF